MKFRQREGGMREREDEDERAGPAGRLTHTEVGGRIQLWRRGGGGRISLIHHNPASTSSASLD